MKAENWGQDHFCGHISNLCGHDHLLFFFVLYTCGISKHKFFWSGTSKKAIFLKFDHFSHSSCSSNSGYEHKKGGHMNPRVLYFTIDLWHIKTYICFVWKLKKGNVLEILPLFHRIAIVYPFCTFHTPCGHQIVVMSTKKVVIWILWFLIAL